MRDPILRMALILGLLSAVGPFAIDMYLPAMPQVAADLHVDEATAALTLTSYFIAFGLAQLIYGPMADALGRKLPLLLGLGIFVVATIGAGFAPDINWLITARAIQGFGAATLMVVPRAVIRDTASGPEAARMMAAIMVVTAVSPMLAPLTGSLVLAWGDWRVIFLILAFAAIISLALVLFVLPETLHPEHRQRIEAKPMLAAAKRLLTDRRFMGLTMIGGFGIASFFVFIATASFVYIKSYNLSPTEFSLAFAFNAIGFFTASQFAARLTARYGMEKVISLAISGFAAALFVLTLVVWAGFDSLYIIIAGLFVGNACLGLVLPTSMVMSLDPHPDIAGMASSLGGTLQMLTGGVMIALAGPFMDNSPLSMVVAIAVCALLSWVAAALSLPRLRLFG